MAEALTGRQVRAARAFLGIKQSDLAARAGVHARTIKMLEKQDGPVSAQRLTVQGVMGALQAAGITICQDNDGGEAVAIRTAGQEIT